MRKRHLIIDAQYGSTGKGRRAGLSSCSNRARRLPGSFLKGRLFSVSSNARMARFNSAREKH